MIYETSYFAKFSQSSELWLLEWGSQTEQKNVVCQVKKKHTSFFLPAFLLSIYIPCFLTYRLPSSPTIIPFLRSFHFTPLLRDLCMSDGQNSIMDRWAVGVVVVSMVVQVQCQSSIFTVQQREESSAFYRKLGLFVGDKSQIVVQFENGIHVFTLLNFGWNSWQQPRPSDTLFSFLKKLPFCLKGTRFTYQKLKPTCVLYKWRHLNSGAYHHDDSIVWPKFLTL